MENFVVLVQKLPLYLLFILFNVLYCDFVYDHLLSGLLVSVFSDNCLLLIEQSMNLFKIYFSPLLYSHFLSFNFFSKHTAFMYNFFNLVSNLCFHFRSVIKYIILLPPVLLPKFLQLFLGWMKLSLYV